MESRQRLLLSLFLSLLVLIFLYHHTFPPFAPTSRIIAKQIIHYMQKKNHGLERCSLKEVAVVTIVRQELEFIVEWLNYHTLLGVSCFYIYCQDDNPNILRDLLSDYIDKGKVVFHTFLVGDQSGSYQHFLAKYSSCTQHFLFLDVDEFVVLYNETNINDFFSKYAPKTKCFEFMWFTFGTSNVRYHPPGEAVTSTYVLRENSTFSGHAGKVAVAVDGSETFNPRSNFWHHCAYISGLPSARVPIDEAVLFHYSLRGGDLSMQRRVERGFLGQFSGQQMYKNLDITVFDSRNSYLDTHLLSVSDALPNLLKPIVVTEVGFTGGTRKNESYCYNSYGKPVRDYRMNKAQEDTLFSNNFRPDVFVFIHASFGNQMRLILSDMLLNLDFSGLYAEAVKITVGIPLDGFKHVQTLLNEFHGRFDKVKIEVVSSATWEIGTLNLMISCAKRVVHKNREAHILYIHTKGMHDHGDPVAKFHWRRAMEYWVIEKHKEARRLLTWGYDTVGSNAINKDMPEHRSKMRVNPAHAWHYSGNFWWATAHHIARLDEIPKYLALDHVERVKAENFILSNMPNMCAGIMCQFPSPHMYVLSQLPLDRYLRNFTEWGRLLQSD